jgi:hypothetical protein
MTSKGINIYKLSGELVGHLPLDVRSSERRLDKSANKLFIKIHEWKKMKKNCKARNAMIRRLVELGLKAKGK